MPVLRPFLRPSLRHAADYCLLKPTHPILCPQKKRYLGLAGNAIGPCGTQAVLEVMGPALSCVIDALPAGGRQSKADEASSLACSVAGLFVDLDGCCLERKLVDGESLAKASNATMFDPSAPNDVYR